MAVLVETTGKLQLWKGKSSDRGGSILVCSGCLSCSMRGSTTLLASLGSGQSFPQKPRVPNRFLGGASPDILQPLSCCVAIIPSWVGFQTKGKHFFSLGPFRDRPIVAQHQGSPPRRRIYRRPSRPEPGETAHSVEFFPLAD